MSQRSLPLPEKYQKFPEVSFQPIPKAEPPGEFDGEAVPWAPYTGGWFANVLPAIQVQPVPSKAQRSSRRPLVPAESGPAPPSSQKIPLPSNQDVDAYRPPGTLAAEEIPWVPKTLG